ncbi:hypothetical protein [Phaffia rhodozyma]|uniref:Uncharacterized protein n=1 Tax=Phaffia rhodozyma TaxID=264483 RepID=A0A0F7SUT0_PHARH|nr:hypothetical protein [Phaffia rhodozyma]
MFPAVSAKTFPPKQKRKDPTSSPIKWDSACTISLPLHSHCIATFYWFRLIEIEKDCHLHFLLHLVLCLIYSI